MTSFKVLLSNISLWQTVFKNFFWLSVSQIFSRLFRFFLVILAIRILGPEEWGIFAYAVGVGALVTIFVDIGVSPVLTREVAKDRSRENVITVLSNSAFIKFFTTAVGFFIVFFLSPYFSSIKEAIPLFLLVAFIITFDNIREFVFSVVRAFEKMEVEAFVNIATNITILFAGLYVIYFAPSAYNLAFAYMAGSAIGAFLGLYMIREKLKGLFSKLSFPIVKMFFVASIPFALYQSTAGALFNTDTYLIGHLKGAKDVGFYAAFQRITQFIFILPSIFSSAVFPKFSKFAKEDKEKLLHMLKKSIKISLFIGLPISAFFIAFSGDIVEFLFSPEFREHYQTFQILMLSFLVAFPVSIFGNLLFSLGLERKFVKSFFVAFAINIVLDIFLIEKIGILGAAIGILLSQVFLVIYFYFVSRKVFQDSLFSGIKNLIISSILLFLLLAFLNAIKVNIIAAGIISAAVYFVLLYYLKEEIILKVLRR